MGKKSDRELVSFRLDPELSVFIREQARLQSISMTELVNRLLRWSMHELSQNATVASFPNQHQRHVSNFSKFGLMPVAYPQPVPAAPIYNQYPQRRDADGVAVMPNAAMSQVASKEFMQHPHHSPLELEEVKRDMQKLEKRIRQIEKENKEPDEI